MEEINTEREPTDAAPARYSRAGPIRQRATDECRAVRQHHQQDHQQDHHIVYPRTVFSPPDSEHARSNSVAFWIPARAGMNGVRPVRRPFQALTFVPAKAGTQSAPLNCCLAGFPRARVMNWPSGAAKPVRRQRLNNPMMSAFASVLKFRLKPTTAAEVSALTSSFSAFTAKTVKR